MKDDEYYFYIKKIINNKELYIIVYYFTYKKFRYFSYIERYLNIEVNISYLFYYLIYIKVKKL